MVLNRHLCFRDEEAQSKFQSQNYRRKLMKRNVFTIVMLMLTVGCFAVARGGGSVADVGQKDLMRQHLRPDMVDDYDAIIRNLSSAVDQVTSTIPGVGSSNATSSCLFVDVQLPDTLSAVDSMPVAHGSFKLVNCGDSGAVTLAFQAIVIIPDLLVDTLHFPTITIVMAAGDTIYREFHFTVPPFSGTYTLCAFATSGSTTASDCATMVTMGTMPPWLHFNECGFLVQGTGCVLFVPNHGQPPGGPGFTLENYGTFQVGDRVCVDGKLNFLCQPSCPEATACILENSIMAAPIDTGIVFRGCGVLVQGTNCVYFNLGHDSLTLVLDNYGSFIPGDSVCVEGNLVWNCHPACPEAVACLTNNTITNQPPVSGVPFHGCGVLVQGPGCVIFMPSVGGNDTLGLVLSNYGGFGPGDSVCVDGTLSYVCDVNCPGAFGCVTGDSITPWHQPPGSPYQACGVLTHGTGCVLFMPISGGGAKYVLENYGAFHPGDSVCVQGVLLNHCQAPCPEATGCIVQNGITNPGPPEPTYQACGLLLPSGNCTVFVPLVGVNPPHYFLQNLGSFGAYDTVCVSGTLVPHCSTYCTNIAGCIINNTISGQNSGPGGTHFVGCGYLVDDGHCVLFRPYADTTHSLLLKLENYGGFVAGDSVCVDGTLYFGCFDACGTESGCIRSNTITGGGGHHQNAAIGLSSQNYPNPFNPSTSISFGLSAATQVKIVIYNMLGQKVTGLVDELMPAGTHRIIWNGTDQFGKPVPSGVYFYRIEAGSLNESRKMLLLK